MGRGLTILFGGVLVLAGCPGDDGDGDGEETETDAPTTSATMSMTASPATSMDAASSPSTTDDDTTGSPDTTTGPPDTTTGPEESSSSTGVPACVGMSFFATSVGSGKAGGNLGGLDGADATCQALADAVGQGGCTWRAYLSTSTEDARDRIGAGPWENSMGDVVAADVDALHTDGLSNGEPLHIFDENGAEVPAQEHDILTGSTEDGMFLEDATCQDWTSNSSEDGAGVGHSDIPSNPAFSDSWNSAHVVNGCSESDLDSTNGAGRIYCFAL